MGLVEIIMIGISVASLAGGLVMAFSIGQTKQKFDDSFDISKCEEGQVIPEIFGRRVVAGNIVWWGNVKRRKVDAGGKGIGGGGGAETYSVFVDVHYVLGIGKLTLNRLVLDDETYTAQATTIFKDSTTATHFDYITNVNACLGVSSVMLKNWMIGENASTVPNILFDVTRHVPSTCPLSYPHPPEMPRAWNPAEFFWYILNKNGQAVDTTNFDSMWSYWDGKNYTVNMVVKEQKKAQELIEQVCKQVDGWVTNKAGVWYCGAWEDERPEGDKIALNTDYMSDIVLNRKTYAHEDVKDDFSVKFLDQGNTDRTVRLKIEAVEIAAKRSKNMAVDLNIFDSYEAAEGRIKEIARRNSNPYLSFSCSLPLRFFDLYVGDWLYIADFFGTSRNFVITKISKNILDAKIEIEAIEALYDIASFAIGDSAETEHIPVTNIPVAALNITIFELGFSDGLIAQEGKLNLCFLVEPDGEYHSGFEVWAANTDGIEYSFVGSSTSFSYKGKIEEALADTTACITPEIDISLQNAEYLPDTYTPAETFRNARFIRISDELCSFEGATALESGDITISNLYRTHENKSTHLTDSVCWICSPADNVFVVSEELKNFKILPFTPRETLGIEDVLAEFYDSSFSMPSTIGLIAQRDTNDVIITFIAKTGKKSGFGALEPASEVLPEILWEFWYSLDDITYTKAVVGLVEITDAAAFIIYGKIIYNGRSSVTASVSIDSAASGNKYFWSV